MKKVLIMLAFVCLTLGLVVNANAAVLFDFNTPGLASGSNATQIGNYMTSLYGSSVTVLGAVSNTNNDLLGTDGHLESVSNPTNGTHSITILFSNPITSVITYDWAREIDNNFFMDYSTSSIAGTFTNLNAVQNINGNPLPGGYDASNYGFGTGFTYDFGSQLVYQIRFHDGASGEQELDNLIVNQAAAVPEPATMSLLGLGLLGLFGVGRKKS